MTAPILICLNAGSSTLKLAAFRGASGAWTRGAGETLPWRDATPSGAIVDALFAAIDRTLAGQGASEPPRAIVHRLVHGGPRLVAPTRIDAAIRAELDDARAFAPLHLPRALSLVDAISQRMPAVDQVACFDTTFHARLPDVARRFALPRSVEERGVRRYGFHGLSYESALHALGSPPPRRLVLAHLGAGSSMAAVLDGASIDTTMGLTPTGGMMMATRSGDLDPGVLLHLMRHCGYDVDALDRLVNHESGLLGVSGTSADMVTLLAARTRDPDAERALAMFAYQGRKSVGALAAALRGLDALVFTGGIGEHAFEVRAAICDGLGHLGVALDDVANRGGAARIDAADARVAVHVIAADEEGAMARAAARLLSIATGA